MTAINPHTGSRIVTSPTTEAYAQKYIQIFKHSHFELNKLFRKQHEDLFQLGWRLVYCNTEQPYCDKVDAVLTNEYTHGSMIVEIKLD